MQKHIRSTSVTKIKHIAVIFQSVLLDWTLHPSHCLISYDVMSYIYLYIKYIDHSFFFLLTRGIGEKHQRVRHADSPQESYPGAAFAFFFLFFCCCCFFFSCICFSSTVIKRLPAHCISSRLLDADQITTLNQDSVILHTMSHAHAHFQ